MTLNGAIMQLVEMRENSLMPVIFKPYFDKVIETISECEEPSVQPEIIRCKDCKHKEREQPGMVYCPMMVGSWVADDHFCKWGERRE